MTYSTSTGWAAYQNVAYQTDSPSAASLGFLCKGDGVNEAKTPALDVSACGRG